MSAIGRKADIQVVARRTGAQNSDSGHIMADLGCAEAALYCARPVLPVMLRRARLCRSRPVGYDRSRKGLRSCQLQGHASVRSRIALHDGFRREWPSKLTRVFSPESRRTGIDDGLTIPTTWPTFISSAGFRRLLQLRSDW